VSKEQIEGDLLRGFPPCSLRQLPLRPGGRLAVCLAVFGGHGDAKESLDQINGYKWRVVPKGSESGKPMVWTVRARFGREMPPPADLKKGGEREEVAAKQQPAAEEKKEEEKAEEVSKTDVLLLHLPSQVDTENIKQVMEGFSFELVSLKESEEDRDEKEAVVRLESEQEQMRAIHDIDGTKVEDRTIVAMAAPLTSQ